jgi:dephospho-CoA kinase
VKRIGLTGGIGSGKSIVAKILISMGYPVYFSDTRSKVITETDQEIKDGLIALFGQEVYTDQGLNRLFLAQQIFNDDSKRFAVNELIHPKVRDDFDHWVNAQNSNLIFNEAAILFETGAFKRFDHTILVIAPTEVRIERVMERDTVTRAEVLSRLEKQWKDEQKIPLADFVITNDEKTPLIVQIEQTVERLSS